MDNTNLQTTTDEPAPAAYSQEEHDRLTQEKKHLQDESYVVSKRLYMKEFNLALLKGVSIIGIVLVILSITLAFFIDLFVAIGITAGILAAVFALLAFFYSRHIRKFRDEKEQIRLKYMDVCGRLDALDGLKEK